MATTDIRELIANPDADWERALPAQNAAIEALVISAGVPLPDTYLEFLQLSNGGEGQLEVLPYNFSIWPAEEVLQWNRSYEVQEYAPGFFAFGSNLGGEMPAFDMRPGRMGTVCAIPFIGLGSEDAVFVASDFLNFVVYLGFEPVDIS